MCASLSEAIAYDWHASRFAGAIGAWTYTNMYGNVVLSELVFLELGVEL